LLAPPPASPFPCDRQPKPPSPQVQKVSPFNPQSRFCLFGSNFRSVFGLCCTTAPPPPCDESNFFFFSPVIPDTHIFPDSFTTLFQLVLFPVIIPELASFSHPLLQPLFPPMLYSFEVPPLFSISSNVRRPLLPPSNSITDFCQRGEPRFLVSLHPCSLRFFCSFKTPPPPIFTPLRRFTINVFFGGRLHREFRCLFFGPMQVRPRLKVFVRPIIPLTRLGFPVLSLTPIHPAYHLNDLLPEYLPVLQTFSFPQWRSARNMELVYLPYIFHPTLLCFLTAIVHFPYVGRACATLRIDPILTG